eukprot:8540392-Prorocentrum_lima.AAC.1
MRAANATGTVAHQSSWCVPVRLNAADATGAAASPPPPPGSGQQWHICGVPGLPHLCMNSSRE